MTGGNVNVVATDVLRALAEPTRWSIVLRIAKDDGISYASLKEYVQIRKAALSYHLRELVLADVVSVRKTGKQRFYQLNREALADFLGQLDTDLAVRGQTLSTRADR